MEIKRKIYSKILKWKQETNGSKALLIEGARSIGKSTVAEEFGQNEYKSYVLIDLKMNKLKPDNFGQMNMYVNYYKNEVNDEGDQNPIGIILCAQKEEALAKMSIQGIENNIYAARYTTVIPNIEVLQAEVERVVLEFNKGNKQ